MVETRDVELYWVVYQGRRRSVALSETEAICSLEESSADSGDPHAWTIEKSCETVPLSRGQVEEGEGELLVLDDDGEIDTSQHYTAVHVFWECPLCGNQHNVGVYNPITQSGPASPAVWHCEEGKGLVLVHW